jgi:hypothetical protein
MRNVLQNTEVHAFEHGDGEEISEFLRETYPQKCISGDQRSWGKFTFSDLPLKHGIIEAHRLEEVEYPHTILYLGVLFHPEVLNSPHLVDWDDIFKDLPNLKGVFLFTNSDSCFNPEEILLTDAIQKLSLNLQNIWNQRILNLKNLEIEKLDDSQFEAKKMALIKNEKWSFTFPYLKKNANKKNCFICSYTLKKYSLSISLNFV